MEYLQHQLDNGLTILAECNPNGYTAALGFFVRTGARDESDELSGVSHFLEHMVFKGTPRRSAHDVNLELDELGSSSNARTGEESTIYHACVLPEFQSRMIELLSDLMRPSLRSEDFETEKKVIIEEIMMYQDQPPYGGHERVMHEFFGGHPLGHSVLGTTDTITQLTPEQMGQYFRSRYCPANMAIAAAGNIDFETLVADARRWCGAWENYVPQRQMLAANYRQGFHVMHKPTSHQQYIMQLAPGPSIQNEERYAMRIAATVIGDDTGSRLFWLLVDSGLAESAGMGSVEYAENGAVLTFVCCMPEQAQRNLDLLNELQSQVLCEGISTKELDLAKRKVASQIVLASERTENRMFSVGSQWLNEQPYRSVSELAAIYEALTLDQVNDVIRNYPLTANTTLVVGPGLDLRPAGQAS
jgi:predicted Zn-dependent peptidase